jgi:uncharacterized BrkB/YihY/UPF0761 family membrane protein
MRRLSRNAARSSDTRVTLDGACSGAFAPTGLPAASAVAFNTLLSILPLIILPLMALTRFIDEALLLSTLERLLAFLVPGQATASSKDCSSLPRRRGLVLAVTPCSSARSLSPCSRTRCRSSSTTREARRRSSSHSIPLFYILFLALGILLVSLMSGALQAMGRENIELFGHVRSLLVSAFLLYLVGVAGEILLLTSSTS